MDFRKYVEGYWSIWLVLVILWNFGFPKATPLWDVIVAVVLSFFFQFLKNKKIKEVSWNNIAYNRYYKTANFFGKPHLPLMHFFKNALTQKIKQKVLDVGCGQGRNALPLAELGYQVKGIALSKVGVEKMLQISRQKKLPLTGEVKDRYTFSDFEKFDFILFDSMLHFSKQAKIKETIFNQKIKALNQLAEVSFEYHWKNRENNSNYYFDNAAQMLVVKKKLKKLL